MAKASTNLAPGAAETYNNLAGSNPAQSIWGDRGGRSATPVVMGQNGYQQLSTNKDDFGGKYGGMVRSNAQAQVGSQNRNQDIANFNQGRDMSNPYEQAQRLREFHQTDAFKNGTHGWGQLDPASQLRERLGSEAYDFRKSLPELMAKQRDSLTHQAGSALDQGLHNTRSDMSSRGLLNSGMREGQEGSMRGRAANQLASQMAGSNADLTKMADSRDFSAAQANLQASQMAMQAQQQADDLHMQNDIRRGQQWQQLASTGGYAAGRYFGGRGNAAPSAGNQSINSSNAQGYDPNSYLNRTA